MAIDIVTKEDLENFKTDLFAELQKLLSEKKTKEVREYLKTWEVMKAFDISKGTLQAMRANGKLPFTRMGKCIYFKYEDIKRLLDENKIHNKPIGQGRNRFSFIK